MRKLLVFNLISVDGYFEGTNHEIDWHVVDEEFNDYAINQLKGFGAILFGRVTYQMMEKFWLTPYAIETDPIVANLMNNSTKFVFSNSLEEANWNNTTLVRGSASQKIQDLKQQGGNDLVIFGSGSLVSSLTKERLIDEYRLIVNPVVLGSGNSMFTGLNGRLKLKLIDTSIFKSGNVLLCYEPDR